MNKHEKINYVEFPAKDIEKAKAFFIEAFGWSFVDYGPEYAAFKNEGLDGGFYKSELVSSTDKGSALIVLYSETSAALKQAAIIILNCERYSCITFNAISAACGFGKP